MSPRWAVLLGWVALVLATQAWPGIDEGIRVEFATDGGQYRSIAEVAPGLPDAPLREQHAERWPVHWAVGSISAATGLDLELVYRLAGLATVAAIVVLLQLLLLRLGLSPGVHAVCLGLALASPYPFRYWLAAPGMLADAVFGLGLTIALLAYDRRQLGLVVAGLAVATLARQTAVPVALAAALLVVWPRTSFVRSRRDRLLGAAALVLVPLGLYVGVRSVAQGFSVADVPSLRELTILADSSRQIVRHLGLIALGIAFPAAALAACAGLRDRRALAPLVLGGVVIAQPLALTSSWLISNEPRLAGLGVPALVVAVAVLLRQVELGAIPAALVCAALFAGSLHHHYSSVGADRQSWLAFTVLGALATLATITLARRSEAVQREAAVAIGDG